MASDLQVAASLFRTRQMLNMNESPVCKLFEGSPRNLPILEEFSTRGCFQLQLNDYFIQLNRDVFDMSLEFFDLDENHPLKQKHLIQSGSLNGYHPYGGLSKYNENRCGFILENDDVLDFLGQGENGVFTSKIKEWREAYHNLAEEILSELSRQLAIPRSEQNAIHNGFDPTRSPLIYEDYFTQELKFIGNGQLHIKRCRNNPNEAEKHVRLLSHTDPSLITMVVHDREQARMMEGAMGLEIYHRDRKQYEKLSAGGWGVVTVFAGDILARISRSCERVVHAPLHRVASSHESPRNAATFFIQPSLDAYLNPIPTQSHANPKKSKTTTVTYGSWKQQKYNKYFKKS